MTSDLITQWRTQAADYLRIAKAYNCRANAPIREGYVKAALTLLSCARELEASIKEGMGEVGERTDTPAGPSEPAAPPTDIPA